MDDPQSFIDHLDAINAALDKVPFDSHFQALPIGLTIAVVAVLGIVWFLLYRRAKRIV